MSVFLENAYAKLVDVGNFGAKINGFKNPYSTSQTVQKLTRSYATMDVNIMISNAMAEGDGDKLDMIASAETGIPRSKLTVVHADDGAGEQFVKPQPLELGEASINALIKGTVMGVSKLMKPAAKRGRKRKP